MKKQIQPKEDIKVMKSLILDNFNSKIGILGHGEIGQALEEVYQNSKLINFKLFIKDIKYKEDPFKNVELDVLNICIPYSSNFNKIVVDEIQKTKAKLTIIHSTVIPYTTKKIRDEVRKSGLDYYVVCSPVRGVHPNLARSITEFHKYIGTENPKEGREARRHFQQLKIKKSGFYKPAVVVELNKLIDTTYYGLCIYFTGYIKDLLEKYKVYKMDSFTHFNKTYNRGYRRMRKREQTNRPTLYPPEKEGLHSHCILQNAAYLHKDNPHIILEMILSLGKHPEEIKGKKQEDFEWLFSEYWGKKRNLKDIGDECGITVSNLKKIMKEKNIINNLSEVQNGDKKCQRK